MKKISLMLVAIATLTILTGCFANETNNEIGNTNNSNVNNEQNKNENLNNKDVPLSMGKWSGNVYTNDFLKLKYNMPENWYRSTDEEIASIMYVGADIAFGSDEFLKEVAKNTSIYFVVASDSETGNNLSIIAEDPLVDITVDYYLEQLKTQLAAIQDIKYEIGEVSTEKLSNVEYEVLDVAIPDYDLVQRYYIRKQDKYIIGIIFTGHSVTELDEIAKSFK